MSKLNFVLIGLLLTSLVAGTAGCLIPLPPTSEAPPSSATTSYTSGIPIDPTWTLPSSNSHSSSPSLPIPEVVWMATPSVVAIQTEVVTYDIFLQPIPGQGVGTGVIFDSNGYIVTNNHVVEGAKSIRVALTDGRTFNAVKVNKDPQTDLAVIKINANGLTKAKLGRSENLQVGERVVAIGNALALEGGPTVTAGIVSYLGRSIQEPNGTVLYDLIQTDAAINPGNSGGPLLNMASEVVGINTAIAAEAQNIGFAISISQDVLENVILPLVNIGHVIRPWLGVTFTELTTATISRYGLSATEGALIVYVEPDSPADKAGLKPLDVITCFAGEKITKAEELRLIIHSCQIRDGVEITFMRGKQELSVEATLIESPP